MYCHEVKEFDICISDTKGLCKVQIDVAKVFNVCVSKGMQYKNINIVLAFNLLFKKQANDANETIIPLPIKNMLIMSIFKIQGL